MAVLTVVVLTSCGDDGGDQTSDGGDQTSDGGPDASLDCSEPALGCPCPSVGEVICTTGEPGPDLLCLEDGWGASFDGPCPGLDAGPPRDFGP